jgi:hypothetical protein
LCYFSFLHVVAFFFALKYKVLHCWFFSRWCYSYVAICWRILYYPPPFPLVGVGSHWELTTHGFFPLYLFLFILFYFLLMSFVHMFWLFLFLVCDARLVMVCFGDKCKPFEKYFLQFCRVWRKCDEIDKEKTKHSLQQLQIQRGKWCPHSRNALCWSFYCVNQPQK